MKKVIATFLAVSMLLTNVGLALSTHFCGGMAVEHQLSIGLADLGCSSEMMPTKCEKSTADQEETQIAKTPCCQDTHQWLQQEAPFEKSPTQFLKLQIPVPIAAIQAVGFYLVAIEKWIYPQRDFYQPPSLMKDVRVLFQVFRI